MSNKKINKFLGSFSMWEDTLKRFPLLILSVIAICGVISLSVSDVLDEKILVKLLLIGIPFALAVLNINIIKEALKLSTKVEYLCIALLAIIAFLGYRALPQDITNESNEYLGFVFGGLTLALHFLVIPATFSKKSNNKDVVTFSITIFYRLLDALLSSLLLCGALSLAILGIDKLFNTHIGRNHAYEYLFIWGIGLFLTFRFLTHFPRLPFNAKEAKSYKNTNTIVVNYIGIPTISIYGIILLFYAIKLIFIDHTFVSWLSVMLTIYFSFGVLIYVLNMANENKNYLAKIYDNYWPKASLPILALYIYDCFKAYQIEGIFETNYAVFMLCLLSIISLIYFLLYKTKDIRMLPLSIVFFALFSILSGPLNIWKSSLNNQKSRLVKALKKNDNIIDGIVQKPYTLLSYDYNLSKGISYIRNKGAIGFLKDYDPNNVLPENLASFQFYSNEYVQEEDSNVSHLEYYSDTPVSIPFVGEGHILSISTSDVQSPKGYSLTFQHNSDELKLYLDGTIQTTFHFNFDHFDVDNNIIKFDNQNYKLTIYTQSLSGIKVGEKSVLSYLEGIAILNLRQKTTR